MRALRPSEVVPLFLLLAVAAASCPKGCITGTGTNLKFTSSDPTATQLCLNNNPAYGAALIANIAHIEIHDTLASVFTADDDVAGMTGLRTLDLRGNRLQRLTPPGKTDLFGTILTALISVDVSHNAITSFPTTVGWTALANLIISHNPIKSDGLGAVGLAVTNLDISYTGLGDLSLVFPLPVVTAPSSVQMDGIAFTKRADRFFSTTAGTDTSFPLLSVRKATGLEHVFQTSVSTTGVNIRPEKVFMGGSTYGCTKVFKINQSDLQLKDGDALTKCTDDDCTNVLSACTATSSTSSGLSNSSTIAVISSFGAVFAIVAVIIGVIIYRRHNKHNADYAHAFTG